MTVIDLAEAAMERVHRMAPCREASEWVERAGHDPLLFVGGRPVRLSDAAPETFRRFKDLMDHMPDFDGMSMADAVDGVMFDASSNADMVTVFHEVLGIPAISQPIIIPERFKGRDIVLASVEWGAA